MAEERRARGPGRVPWGWRHAAAIATIVAGGALLARGVWEAASRAPAPAASSGSVATASALAPPPPRAPEPETRRDAVRWTGRVTMSTVSHVALGTECVLEAIVESPPRHPGRSPETTLACGGAVLFRAWRRPPHGTKRSWVLTEHPGERDGTFRYGMTFVDESVGDAGPDRVDFEVDTFQVGVRIRHGGGSPYEIVVTLADDLSEPREGPPFEPEHASAEPTFREGGAWRGQVRATTGDAPVEAGMPCEVRLRPTFPESHGLDCRLLVRCVDRVLFPGYAQCASEDGRARGAKDGAFTPDDGDPKLDLDLGRRSLMLEDRTSSGSWSVSIAIAPDAPPAPRP